MSYVPRPGSQVEAAINYIRKAGSARSGDIALAIGMEQKNVAATLVAAVSNGALVACDVEVPGKQPQKEFRIGAGMPSAALTRPDLAAKPARRPPRPEAAPAQPPASPAPERPAKSQRPAAKVQRKTAKKTATAKPGKNIPKIVPAPLPASPLPNFRCGIFSDGALRLDGDFLIDQGGVVIDRDQTAILVKYLHKHGEMGAA